MIAAIGQLYEVQEDSNFTNIPLFTSPKRFKKKIFFVEVDQPGNRNIPLISTEMCQEKKISSTAIMFFLITGDVILGPVSLQTDKT